jgi:hypothetical protein
MRQDRFLSGILIFIGVLVLLAVSLFWIRQRGEQSYGPEDAPEGVVRNYVLALQKGDYPRAYSYLANLDGRPDSIQFQQSMSNNSRSIADSAIQIGATQTISAQESSVLLDIVQNQGGLFSNPYHQSQTASLVRQGTAWKIRNMPYPYWSFDIPAAPVKPTLTP